MKKRIVVPEGMRMAALKSVSGGFSGSFTMAVDAALYEALKWLSANPIEPTSEMLSRLKERGIEVNLRDDSDKLTYAAVTTIVIEWQRRMFLAPPDEDEPIRDLLLSVRGCSVDEIDKRIREAYRRGRKQ